MTTKTEAEINAEKASKSRPDKLPACALMGGGLVMAYGLQKHGNCTWRVAGTEQADPETHIASAYRHVLEWLDDPSAVEAGSRLPVLYHALSQIAIAIDCIENPAKPLPEIEDGWTQDGYVSLGPGSGVGCP